MYSSSATACSSDLVLLVLSGALHGRTSCLPGTLTQLGWAGCLLLGIMLPVAPYLTPQSVSSSVFLV